MSAFVSCKKCGEPGARAMATVEHPTYNWLRRRRYCKHCGYRWWTVELAEEDLTVDAEA